MSALKTSRTHSLKTWPDPFAALERGEKSFEFRKNDRDYMVGDQLVLNEWNPLTGDYAERILYRTVSYIVRGPAFGIPDGYCVMSLAAPEAARSLSAEDVARDAVVDATMAWWAVLSVQGAVALAHPTLVPEWRAACAALAKLKP